MILSYMRNKVFEVEPMGSEGMAIRWRLVDSHLDMEIRMETRFPDLEITKVDVRIERSPHQECKAVEALAQKIVGVRIGGGLREIVIGLVGGKSGCGELTQGILDCCNGVILKPIRKDQLIAMVEELLKVQVRKWQRREVCLPCKVSVFQEGKDAGGTIRTLGGGGAFFEYPVPLFTGAMCRLRFTLPGTDRKVMVWSAVVVWTGKLNQKYSEGAGVRFLSIDREDQAAVDYFSSSGQGEEPGRDPGPGPARNGGEASPSGE